MAIFDTNINIKDFITLTEGGIQVLGYSEIRDYLIALMKKIYGNDIDTSSATADGQWLNQIALLINNCLQTVKYSFDMLDPASATNHALDVLCSFNNIFRYSPSYSTAQLLVKNISGIQQSITNKLLFIDKNGTEWEWTPNKLTPSVWEDGEVKLLDVVCSVSGPIVAQGTGEQVSDWSTINENNNGFINKPVEYGVWKIYQQDDAIVGHDVETDEALRARRFMSTGNSALTTLSSLQGSLLNITGIKDVFIYNNASTAPKTLSYGDMGGDETTVDQHSVYICVRYDENAVVEDSVIGNIIYNKLTPGIPTTQYSGSGTGENKPFELNKSENYKYTVYWKKCSPLAFNSLNNTFAQINFLCLTNVYDYPTSLISHTAITDSEKAIADAIIDYINNIKLSENIASAIILSSNIQKADLNKNGQSTFVVTSSYFYDNTSTTTDTKDNIYLKYSYYNLTRDNIIFNYSTVDYNQSTSQATIIIKDS